MFFCDRYDIISMWPHYGRKGGERMDDKTIIQGGLDYIEEHLQAQIGARELADMAGFSLYHYYRIFQQYTGLPVMRYIQRRRLLHGIYAIAQGSTKTEGALQYGFDTYSGFYKAFYREFGCSPSEYLHFGRVKQPCRINLMKEEYMTVTTKKAARILANWGLEQENVSDIYYEGTGNRNDSALYVGEDHVLKYTADLSKMRNHICLSKEINRQGLISPVPVLTTDGRDYICEGEYYYYVTRRLPGKQLTAADLYQGAAFSVGEAIGKLHQVLKDVEACVNDMDLLDTLKTWALPKATQLMEDKGKEYVEYMRTFEVLYPSLPRQIIHRDPNPGNIVADGTAIGFVDFDLSERNVRIFDVCYAATAVLSESFGRDDGKWLEFLRDIIRGYDCIVCLTEEERRAIPYVILANQLICVAWFEEQEKYKDLLEINKRMTSWLQDHFAELKSAASI